MFTGYKINTTSNLFVYVSNEKLEIKTSKTPEMKSLDTTLLKHPTFIGKK